MQGDSSCVVAVLYAPGDVRVEDRDDPTIVEPTDADHPAGRHLRLRLGPVALPRHRAGRRAVRRWATSTSASSRRSAATVTHDQARPVRGRLVLRLRQHLRDLPGRLPDLLRTPASPVGADRRAGRVRCASRSPTAPWSPPPTFPSDDLIPSLLAASDVLGTGWFGAVAADGRPGQDRRRRRRRRGRPARGPGRQAARRRADHRDEPPRAAPEARPRVRRHRHRHRARRRGRGRGSRSSPTGSARTR